ncbi:MAG: penicillin-binding protein 1B [Wenzhouxiangellaceae bacterium]|nr:penicillin-binding protein 1B [Wenzhouxiangellaceae bacterium]
MLSFALGIMIGCLGPWAWYLDREASNRFAERQWTQAGRVYARPLELYPERLLSSADLELELRAAGMLESLPLLPGRYARGGNQFQLVLPELRFADGRQAARQLRLSLSQGRISELVDADGKPVDLIRLPPAELGSLLPLDDRDRTLVPIAELPPLLVAGIQAVEDRQFRHHHGLDPKAILRALWSNLRSGDIGQGGSTITQQLVKNLFLTSEKSILRKFNEAIMSISLEARFSKSEILEAYLNDVYLGQNGNQAIHGFGRAAEFYFGLPVQSLSADQIALLIGMVRGASWYHPTRNPERALARRNLVLDVFLETGLIDAEAHRQASERGLGAELRDLAPNRNHPAFMDLVRRQLKAGYRDSDLREKGLRIFTTLSPSAQHHAERALTEGLDQQTPGLQGAIVLAQPDSGELRALVGDRNVRRSGFNRALDARRPIGSVIKPFVYLLALADPDRFSLVTPIEDAPLSLPQPGRPDWQPGNYDGTSHGMVPLMTALANSYNQATVRIGLQIGVEPLFRLLEQLGVAPGQARHPAAFLGAIDLSPLQVTQIYQALAAGGYSTPLRAITDVVDSRGKPIARYPIRLRPIRDREALALLDFALAEVVERGTARTLKPRLQQSAARSASIRGKTGTTSDRRDAWFAGFTSQWLGVVWVGRDDNQPAGVSGAASAMPIWARMFDMLPNSAVRSSWPSTLEWYWTDWPSPTLADERCPNARAIPFIAGSQPPRYSQCLEPSPVAARD